MVNRRGWLRIVEAIVSILIVFGAVLTVATTNRSNSEDFCLALPPLLDEISKNVELRQQIVSNEKQGVTAFIQNQIRNPSIDYEVQICSLDEICTHTRNGADDLDVCADDRVISGTLEGYAPRRLKVYLFKQT